MPCAAMAHSPKYDITTPHQELILIRNPSIEENTHRQRGSKLVFDGVELPRVRTRQTRSRGDEDRNEDDENMEIQIGTKSPARMTATRGRRIARQSQAVTGNIPASDLRTLSEQLFARGEGEYILSRGTSPFSYCPVG